MRSIDGAAESAPSGFDSDQRIPMGTDRLDRHPRSRGGVNLGQWSVVLTRRLVQTRGGEPGRMDAGGDARGVRISWSVARA